ncbi:hypothetical protein QQL38_24105 [Pseudomonas syringae]|uniref:hypothetical protein n=1 Tax=Pseudomonas syringae TaxID=317 RepID=UPI003D8079E3
MASALTTLLVDFELPNLFYIFAAKNVNEGAAQGKYRLIAAQLEGGILRKPTLFDSLPYLRLCGVCGAYGHLIKDASPTWSGHCNKQKASGHAAQSATRPPQHQDGRLYEYTCTASEAEHRTASGCACCDGRLHRGATASPAPAPAKN